MRQHGIFAETLLELMRDAFGEPTSVHKDQRGAVRLDQLRESVVDLAPGFR